MRRNPNVIILMIFSMAILFSCRRSIPTLSGDWKHQASFIGQARQYPVLFVIGNYAYVGTGYSPLTQTWWSDFYAYNTMTDQWTQIANFPGTPRQEAVAFAVGGKGYVGCGYYGKNLQYLRDFYSYDPIANVWAQVDSLPGPPRKGSSAFVLNDTAYVGTGLTVDTANRQLTRQDFSKFDPTTKHWYPKASFSGPKVFGAFSFVLNNTSYLAGGYSNAISNRFTYQYFPGQNKWIKKSNLDSNINNLPRGETVSFVIQGANNVNFAYVATGASSFNGGLSDCYQYNSAQDTWIQYNSFEGGSRSGAVGFSVPGTTGYRAYLGLGGIGSTAFDDWWSFNPDVPQIINN